VHVLNLNTHTAYLDPISGEGFLVLPLPGDDLDLDGVSLHGSAELHALRELESLGYELTEDEDGYPWLPVGYTADGRQVVGLCGLDPIVSDFDVELCTAALAEFSELVGLVQMPAQRQGQDEPVVQGHP
jgi:hypothetical protein